MGSGGWRGFPLFWAGRAASQFGDEITFLALPWLIVETTSSPLAVGLLQAFALLPVIVLGLPLGALSDRRSRRRSMIEADLLRFGLLLSLPIAVATAGHATVQHALAVAFVAGIGRALFDSSSQAFLADLVPMHQIVHANARISATEGIAIVAGPSVAGVLIAAIGASGALIVDSVTFLVAVASVALIYPVRERLGRSDGTLHASAREGLRFMNGHRQLRVLTTGLAAANLGSGIVGGLIVFFFQRTLSLAGWEAGLAYAANGIGVLIASYVSVRVSNRHGFGRTVIVGLWSTTCGFALLALATRGSWVLFGAGGMAVLGFGVTVSVVASASLRQRLVPAEMLGRVTAGYRIFVSGAMAVGAILGGLLGKFASVRTAIAVAVVIYCIVAVCVSLSALNGPDAPEVGGVN